MPRRREHVVATATGRNVMSASISFTARNPEAGLTCAILFLGIIGAKDAGTILADLVRMAEALGVRQFAGSL